MPLPSSASHGSRDNDFREFMQSTQSLRKQCQVFNSLLASGDIDSETLLGIAEYIAQQKLHFDTLKAIEGIADTIVEKARPAVTKASLIPDFVTTVNALVTFVTTFNANFPAARYFGSPIVAADGRRNLQTWTTQQTAPLRALLTAIINSIDG